MHILAPLISFAVLCTLSSFLSTPPDHKVWLTSADDDVLRFSVPKELRKDSNAFSGLIFFCILGCLLLAHLQPQAAGLWLYKVVPIGIIDLGIVLHLFSLSKFTINVRTQTYELTSRWLWHTSIHRGPLNDFHAIYISERNDVGLVYRKPGLRIGRVVPIGKAGFGGDAMRLAEEVGQRTGLEVVTKL